jgi:hypothetical protein
VKVAGVEDAAAEASEEEAMFPPPVVGRKTAQGRISTTQRDVRAVVVASAARGCSWWGQRTRRRNIKVLRRRRSSQFRPRWGANQINDLSKIVRKCVKAKLTINSPTKQAVLACDRRHWLEVGDDSVTAERRATRYAQCDKGSPPDH